MIPQDLDKYRRAGEIVARVRDFGKTLITPGARIEEIAMRCEAMIREMGAEPAFPTQLSRNHIAAHYCSPPGDPTTVGAHDIIKLDLGAHIDGYLCDSAVTVDLAGGPDSMLLMASRSALENAIAHMGPGAQITAIGQVIEDTIRAFGYKPVTNLTGHGVARWTVHCAPSIPNYADKKAGRLRPGMTVACEPFASDGKGHIDHDGRAEVFQMKRAVKTKDRLSRKWEEAIGRLNGLPFARRDLHRLLSPKEGEDLMWHLQQHDLVIEYPPLCEKAGVRISQHEHTIFITETGAEVLTLSRS
jgi:methionyl aminopeptidase